jgi:hypothetical protein
MSTRPNCNCNASARTNPPRHRCDCRVHRVPKVHKGPQTYKHKPNGDHEYPQQSRYVLRTRRCEISLRYYWNLVLAEEKEPTASGRRRIIKCRGNKQVVISLDVEYGGSKEATVLMWFSGVGFEDDGTPYLQAKIIDNEVRPLDFNIHTTTLFSDWYLSSSFAASTNSLIALHFPRSNGYLFIIYTV